MISHESFLAGDDQEYRTISGKMLAIYLHFMQDVLYIYQGEEIVMINYPVKSIDEVDDIEKSKNVCRTYKKRLFEGRVDPFNQLEGRDNARHPMQWNNHKMVAFTEKALLDCQWGIQEEIM